MVLITQTQLITNKYLESLNLAVNTELGLVICLPCGAAYTGEGTFTHLSKIHDVVLGGDGMKEKLKKSFLQFEIPEKVYPELPPTQLYRAFDGLGVVKTLGCPLCFQNGSQKTLQNHMRDCHPDSTVPRRFEDCFGQYINKSSTKVLLRVQVEQSRLAREEPTTGPLKEFMVFHGKERDLTKATAPNARFISTFLQRTGWYDHVQPYSIPMIHGLVGLPGPSEFAAVIGAIEKYFEDGNELLDFKKTPELVLQRLNSDNPQTE